MTSFKSDDNNVPAVDGEHSGFGAAVAGNSAHGTGVHGVNDAPGGSSLKPDAGTGLWGESTNGLGVFGSSDNNVGIKGMSVNQDGVQGLARANGKSGVTGLHSAQGNGIFGQSASGQGVTGVSNLGIGVFGQSTEGDGVQGITRSKDRSGLTGLNQGGGRGLTAVGSPAGHFDGDVEVTGDIRLINSDCAEDFDVIDLSSAEPGTVMVLDRSGVLRPSHSDYDRMVVGVVSGAGNFKPGIILGKYETGAPRMPIALMGKVYCKADASRSPIEVGDLVTTSDTPGHAMKANDPVRAFGCVIGKALQPLATGRGLIAILIAMQ